MSRKAALAAKRAQLVAQAGVEREELAKLARSLDKPLFWAGQGLAMLSALRMAPAMADAILELMIKSPGAKRFKWPRLLWSGWKLFATARQLR